MTFGAHVILISKNKNWRIPIKKQERITFHRGANFTIRLVFNSFEGSTIREKSIKMYCAQEARLVDLYYSLAHSLLPDLIVG